MVSSVERKQYTERVEKRTPHGVMFIKQNQQMISNEFESHLEPILLLLHRTKFSEWLFYGLQRSKEKFSLKFCEGYWLQHNS